MFYSKLESLANELMESENCTFDSAVKLLAKENDLQKVGRIHSEDLDIEGDTVAIIYELYNDQYLVVVNSLDLDESYHLLSYDIACAKATERVYELSN